METGVVLLKQVAELVWEIPKEGEMRVPGRIYGSKSIIDHLTGEGGKEWNALTQIQNVACLPGIQKASIAMSDVHPGYGFPIGGVGAFDIEEGVVSVAGVGFDCNCGVRCLRTNLTKDQVLPQREELANVLYRIIPAGLGSGGEISMSKKETDQMLREGARFAVKKGLGLEEDLEFIEEKGCVAGADPAAVSQKAKERQNDQLGSLGSGNHYLEVQFVDEIFDQKVAAAFGLFPHQIVVFIHCGSRGLGHQVGTDYLVVLERASRKYGIPIREHELVCAPITSPEGKEYISAVMAAINCAFANRQVLAHLTRRAFQEVFKTKPEEIPMLYDVGHNTCKFEEHEGQKLLVHRKGATRAFGPGHPDVPRAYQEVGQPVLIGGTMGTCSYILCGTEKGMKEAFGSSCHGAGRLLSRHEATRRWRAEELLKELAGRGILVKGHSFRGLAEEAPGSYKDVNEVVMVMDRVGLSKRVARLSPLICIKG